MELFLDTQRTSCDVLRGIAWQCCMQYCASVLGLCLHEENVCYTGGEGAETEIWMRIGGNFQIQKYCRRTVTVDGIAEESRG